MAAPGGIAASQQAHTTGSMSSAKFLVLAFAALILAGAGLLHLPFTTHEPISFVDALFTATSAVCVVGLTVLDMETDFTAAGQVVVLVLIQLGGVGIITLASLLILAVRRRLSVGTEELLGATVAVGPQSGFREVVVAVITFTLAIELVGALLLFAFWPGDASLGMRLWHSVFHAVSAFCNAGFALFSGNLVGLEGNWGVNLTLMVLIILGGFGFMNLQEIAYRARMRRLRWSEFSLFLKISIAGTAVLSLLGAVLIYITEHDIAFANLAEHERVLAALFHSVSARTAGFNTVPVNRFTDHTLQLLIVLMFIGAGSGSCAGGIKISTVAVLFGMVRAYLRNEREPILFNRRLSVMDERKAMVLFFAAMFAVVVGLFVIFLLQGKAASHLDSEAWVVAIRFEVVSALGTVGLSTGATGELNTASRFVLIVLMLIGRLGPLTILTAWLGQPRGRAYTAPEEAMPIG